MTSTVELYDAGDPGRPRLELSANFHPDRHVRWAHRPAMGVVNVESIDGLSAKAAEGLGRDVVTFVDLVRVLGDDPSYLSAKAKEAIARAMADEQGFIDAMCEPEVAADEETAPEGPPESGDEPADEPDDAGEPDDEVAG